MQFSIKIFSLIFLLFGNQTLAGDKYSWSKIKLLEKKMVKWTKTVTEEDLIKIGKMKQRPREVEYIRAFFPYLLPKKFLTYNVDMECYPAFSQFKESKNSEAYQKWEECLQVLYRQETPRLIKKALKDLKP